MSFHNLKQAVSAQFNKMGQHTLFITDVSKEKMRSTYLEAFPEGTNLFFRERTEHDCNCCYRFIRDGGNVVAMIDGKLESIWDIETDGVDEHYQIVAKAMSELVKSAPIKNIYLHEESEIGTDQNEEVTPSGTLIWEHFHQVLPRSVVVTDGSIASRKGLLETHKTVLKRSIEDITPEAIEIVMDLIEQKSLYRGEQFQYVVEELRDTQKAYELADNKDYFLWTKALELGTDSGFRNTCIGTLLVAISEGEKLPGAIESYTVKAKNYMRSTTDASPLGIKNAQKKLIAKGIENTIYRRFAVPKDITINNVLFADRSAKKAMGENVFDELIKDVSTARPNFDKVEEVTIENFMANILPKAEGLELLMEDNHVSNLVSLIAAVHSDAGHLFKWNNDKSWSYYGEVADSVMRERVKSAGGKVDGVLRYSIQWNEKGENRNDLDAHCIEPTGLRIHYPIKGEVQHSSGMLDVDIMHPTSTQVAVENIIYTNEADMPEGDYTFLVDNFSERGGKGFTAEIEFGGKIYSFSYDQKMRENEKVVVGVVNYSKENGFTLKSGLKGTAAGKEIWGIKTHQFHKVNMVMLSPNHWDDQQAGNKHYFFMLEDCVNPDQARGFYNEFLRKELHPERKVFEMLASKMKTEHSDEQLSGLGFSSTLRNEVLCKVKGSFNRTIKIKF